MASATCAPARRPPNRAPSCSCTTPKNTHPCPRRSRPARRARPQPVLRRGRHRRGVNRGKRPFPKPKPQVKPSSPWMPPSGQEAIGIYNGPLVVARTADGLLHVHPHEEIIVATGAAEIMPSRAGVRAGRAAHQPRRRTVGPGRSRFGPRGCRGHTTCRGGMRTGCR